MNWAAFLRQHKIPFTTTGVSKGWIGIKCPICGPEDPSEHLGIHQRSGRWHCWRNPHSSVPHNGVRLVQLLTHCTFDEARQILGEGGIDIPSDDDLIGRLHEQLGVEGDQPRRSRTLSMPAEFKPIIDGSRYAEQFIEYLARERDYRMPQVYWLCQAYNLHYAVRGRFRYRVIVPVYSRRNELLTWTARTILSDEENRYLALSRAVQICPPKETLLGLPLLWECKDPRALVVCEGPFDAIRVTVFGRSFGVYGTCLFGLNLHHSQMELLAELRALFPRQYLLLDSEASFQAFRMANEGHEMIVERLPPHIKDPGEMPAQSMVDLCIKLAN